MSEVCSGSFVSVWRAAILPWRSIAPIARPDPSTYSQATIARGRQLAALGDCAICHTDASGIVNAGGRAIETPFGKVYSTSVTPDPATGIGTWSYPAFERAMREGIHRDGRQLYPAFPHPHFAKVTDADLQALYAYLMVQAPVRAENLRSALTFPFNLRPLLAGWNALFHASSVRTGPGKINDMEWRRLSGRGPRPLRRMSFASPIASR
jgi:nicotinate dehydrogenase subunit B